jgi:hypothetical protein
MTVMREFGEVFSIYFDGCHRNSQELTGITVEKPEYLSPIAPSCFVKSLISHACLWDVTLEDYNKNSSLSFD